MRVSVGLWIASATLAVLLAGCRERERGDQGRPPAAPPAGVAPTVAGPAASASRPPEAPDVTPPTAPADVAATASATSVELSWTGSSDDVGVEGYEVLREGAIVARSGNNTARETGLVDGRSYCYTVRAFDAAGNRSPASAPACVTTPDVTPPTSPRELAAALSTPTEAALTWSPSQDAVGVARYEVFRSGRLVATSSEPRALDAGLAPARRYCWNVEALDAAGNRSPRSDAACLTTPDVTLPSTPEAVAVDPRLPYAAQVTWSPSTDDVGVTGYEVHRGETIAAVAGPAFLDTALAPEKEHCWSVVALDAAGNRSQPSPPVCRTLPDVTPPTAPADLAAAAPGETEIALQWGASTDDVGVVGYEVYRGDELAARTTGTAARDAGRRPWTEYCYAVRALDARGNRSAPSSRRCIRTPDLTPPTPPPGAVAAAESDEVVALHWGAATDNVGVVRYAVRRGADRVFRTEALELRETGLKPAREYCYLVSAIDAAGNESAPSARACATTPDLKPPTTPASPAASPRSATEVFLAWGPSEDDVGVTGYEVLRDGAVVASVTATRASVKGLAPSTEYCYQVRARDAAGNRSPAAGPVCASTAPDRECPVAPVELRVSPTRPGTVELRWEPSESDGVVYTVYRDDGARGVGATSANRFLLGGLKAGERHCFRVAAVDRQGRESPKCLPACAAAPGPPSASR